MNIEIAFDEEARRAILAAIKMATRSLQDKCNIYLNSGYPKSGLDLIAEKEVPTWKLMEIISLLSILSKAKKINTKEIYNILGVTGPIEIIEDEEVHFVWIQPTIEGSCGLSGRPDIVITSTPVQATSSNTLRIIECKCRKQLSAPDIRAEFGKAHDLNVASYFIWSFKSPSEKLINGAKKLGIDLVPFGFDTDMREEFIKRPHTLLGYVSDSMERSRKEILFAKMLIDSGEMIQNKLRLNP